MSTPLCFGIDLGTTNSCIAAYSDTKCEVLENMNGAKTIPSIVSFDDGKLLVGLKHSNNYEIAMKILFCLTSDRESTCTTSS